MKEIKCPKCGTAITVNDADFAELISQVRTEEFNTELDRRVAEMKQLEAARNREALGAKEHEIEILRLKAQQAVADAVARKEEEIRKKEVQIEGLEKEVELYKNFKAKRSVKLLGEDLEQHCYAQYNQMLLPVMPGATFEKDNESVREDGETSGTKGDFIFRLKEDGVDVVSIMFEMKNESDVTATKHRNADFYAKLDSDRKKKDCEYAVLVSMLELDNDGFSGINVVPGYEKMYMVRPDQFIPIITLLVQSGKKSLDARKQLDVIRGQREDVSNFEKELEKFKDGFGRNLVNAKKKYDEAIEGIDKAIEKLQNIKKALQVSTTHLDAAGNKVEDLTIRKLTFKNPTMKAAFDEARAKRVAEEGPDEQ